MTGFIYIGCISISNFLLIYNLYTLHIDINKFYLKFKCTGRTKLTRPHVNLTLKYLVQMIHIVHAYNLPSMHCTKAVKCHAAYSI